MLKGIDPVLSPDLLHTLASMGHGDELAIVDANYPAAAFAQRLVRLDGLDAITALRAILTLFPLDQYTDAPVTVMAVVDDAHATPAIYGDFQEVIDATETVPVKMERLERFAFYERSKKAFCIMPTCEQRLYGNIILSKGVVSPLGV